MPFSVEEFRDLLRILEQRPEWRAELRGLVLADELLTLPEQMASLRAETERRFQQLLDAQRRLEERMLGLADQVAKLTDQVMSLTEQMEALTGVVHVLTIDVGELKGDNLERRYRERAPSYFGRVIRRIHVLSAEELSSALEEAVRSGYLTESEEDEILLADLVVRGHRRGDGAEVYLVVEVSWGIGPQDVERAIRRASLLAKVGTPVLPVVAGKGVSEEAASLIRTRKVWQVVDGQTFPP